MRRTIGVTTSEHVVVGVVENHKVLGSLRVYPEEGSSSEALLGMPADAIAQVIRQQIVASAQGQTIEAIGIGFPGIIRGGIIEESPNLQQLKGSNMQETISAALREAGIKAPVFLYNDADIVAAGLAATRGQLDRLIRVWTLSNGIGFGLYPFVEGVWEGGHQVVSLDPNEKYCGCGGRGHLEGIMGHRAMRLRFLDMEPDEVFESAAEGDQRCCDFVKLWHRALAAATANSIHMAGPGKFFISGHNAKHLDIALVNQYLNEMVKMSPLQGYVFEVVPGGDEIAVIGAAVNAEQAAFSA
ncbi:MAG: ROK family protein [Bryobacteraceae bacterium]